MSSIFGAYLEDYNQIKIIIPINTVYDNILITSINYCSKLTILKTDQFADESYLYCSYDDDILLHEDYYIIINEQLKYHLNLGKITRSKRFDIDNYYDGFLGFIYNKEYTVFKIWSPVCKEVILVLENEEHHLKYKKQGLWEIKINKDLENCKYYYKVRVNEQFEEISDPYGISCSSNLKYNYVIDKTKLYQMKHSYVNLEYYSKAFIYEMNFRDLNKPSKEEDSLYLKAIEKIDYFKNLSVTHLQLMPTFTFGGVFEEIKLSSNKKFKYNWGYNPISYMTPSGWYCSDASSPTARINELKQFIDMCHLNNIGVNMDVVFNHVYIHETFPLGILVPGYVYRTNNQGFLMNSSYCGNDIRTEALMIRKFITDTIKYYQEEFLIDGFRFDLMGLIDNDTMLLIKEEVMKKNPSAMLYGEGWYMDTTINIDQNANLGSATKLYPVAFFNDYFRNVISGSMHGKSSFITGEHINPNILLDCLCKGSKNIMPFVNAHQSLNYIECHDNYTFYDKCKYLYEINNENQLVDYCKLGIGLVLLSNGIKFIHSGQELMRTKYGNDNSYNLGDDINSVDFSKINKVYDLRSYIVNLLSISNQIENKELGRCYFNDEHYEIRYQYDKYQIIIKNNYEEEDKYFVPGTTLIFNNGLIVNEICESLQLKNPGIWILKK